MRLALIIDKAQFAFIRLLNLPFSVYARLRGRPYQIVVPSNTYAPWIQDKTFGKIFREGKRHSLVNIYQAWELWKTVENTANVPGDILEVGVWRGSSTILMGSKLTMMNSSKKIYSCDTFKGVVKGGHLKDNFYQGGEHKDTSLGFTQNRIKAYHLNNVELLEGIFPEQTSHRISDKNFSLCHIDVDTYESGKGVLDWVWPRLRVGGMVIFNDYGFPLTQGITELVNEQVFYADRLVLHNLNGNGILVKIG